MSNHTELPWHIEDTNGARLSKVIVANKLGLNGSTVVVGQLAGPDKDANADFILTACSSFWRMRSALEKISCPSQSEGLLWWQKEARAALSEAPAPAERAEP